MHKPLLAALAVAGVATLAVTNQTPPSPTPELTYYLPICSPRLPAGTFCIEAPDLAALRPPHIPPEVWQLIIAR